MGDDRCGEKQRCYVDSAQAGTWWNDDGVGAGGLVRLLTAARGRTSKAAGR